MVGRQVRGHRVPGSNSWEFIENNFAGQKFHDTVYITANPHARKLPDDTFFLVETTFDSWSNPPGTVLPEAMVKRGLALLKEFPDKRLIVHFIQAHGPHLGPTADAYRERHDIRQDELKWTEPGDQRILDENEIRQAYVETLDRTLNAVDHMVGELEGKTALTADHGQLLGERLFPLGIPKYGHPHDLHTEALRIVPWFECEWDKRREVVSGDPSAVNRTNEDVVEDGLEALGYR